MDLRLLRFKKDSGWKDLKLTPYCLMSYDKCIFPPYNSTEIHISSATQIEIKSSDNHNRLIAGFVQVCSGYFSIGFVLFICFTSLRISKVWQ